ncbi:hypothetical protein [Speluncibacter jeojiensis]|uniref:Membrane-anchored protein n=1 Tax=Speluncibacter jeojiensis TaxID=2710754 RepID=A0A9X4LYW1_9ACTN|nr:hypothetical protein [Corynebacteriales bacterium D3-21]
MTGPIRSSSTGDRPVDPVARPDPAAVGRYVAAKVPAVTAAFWIIKILTTGMGETISDYLVFHMDPVLAVALTGILLAVALATQFAVRRYLAGVYWFAVVMVSVFGTMVADAIHVVLGVPYVVSVLAFAILLTIVLMVWHRSEKTLSIHSIHTPRREAFYWLTVVTTFALGTAVGDMTATTLHLGYLASGLLFAVVIVIPWIAHARFGFAAVPAFWAAYIVTRPLGASFSDWAAVSHERGGLNLGTGAVSIALAIAIAVCVGYLAVTHADAQPAEVEPRVH